MNLAGSAVNSTISQQLSQKNQHGEKGREPAIAHSFSKHGVQVLIKSEFKAACHTIGDAGFLFESLPPITPLHPYNSVTAGRDQLDPGKRKKAP